MTHDELLALIDRAAREEWKELDLRDEDISELPGEIGQLTKLRKLAVGCRRYDWVRPEDRNQLKVLPSEIGLLTQLQEIDLRWNQLEIVPSEIGKLTNLQLLSLSGNQLTTISPEIGKLTNLQKLNLSGNQLATLPTEIIQLISLQSLDLRSNQLTTLPPEIGQLANLQRFNLSSNQLTALPSGIGQLTNLTSLLLDLNRLTTLPLEIGKLTNLTLLILRYNQLTILPPGIDQLTNMQGLDLSRNQLTTLPPEIGRLTNLQRLDLSSNRLTTLPPEIGQLINLQRLNLSENQLMTLPSGIGKLTNLQWLGLSENRLKSIASEISQMINLRILTLINNQLTGLPPELGQLTNLKELILEGNQITALPPEISQLANLQILGLGGNLIAEFPSEIAHLINLQTLILSGNQLTTLPPEIGQLTNLTSLFLFKNQLTMLPATLRQLAKLDKLHLHYNPLPLPPELLGNPDDPKTTLNAYFQASRPLCEAKLLLIGEGSVGKTSLVERLLWNKPPSDSGKTIGVDIHEWAVDSGQWIVDSEQPLAADGKVQNGDPDPIRLNVWDFGGQEIYHATHQFFLTHRSLYLLVIESRKDEAANRLDYWLRHIQSFAGDAPVILVINKIDQHLPTLDERGLRLKYPTIHAIIHTSCTEGTGIEQLRQAITDTLATMPHINDWIPLTWFAVKEKLAKLDEDYLPYERYVELCQAEGIEHEAAQQTLARFLHDLGAALNFQDDHHLAGTNVLNPEWVTGGIYHILNAQRLQGKGILRLNDLDQILNRRRYPHHKQPFLLDIMRKFELCVPLGDGRRYLVPGLLPKERADFEWPTPNSDTTNGAVVLEYHYAILPPAVLSRLMVRLHGHTWHDENDDPIRWRNGLVLTRDGCRALVVADPAAAHLTIALDGSAPHRRHLLAVIRAQLDEIHVSFAKLEAKEWVPIPGHPQAAIPYRALLNLEARRIFTHYEPTYDVEIDVRALLDGIESPEERDIRSLVNTLQQHFDKAELRQLAFEVGIDHEDLPGETKSDLARELALACRRQGRLAELEEKVRGERPFLVGRSG